MSEVFTPDNLIAGTTQTVCDIVTIASGASLKRGAVLGRVTATGKYKLSASAAVDGSQTPSVILADDVDATSADVTNVAVYIKGEFASNALFFGVGHSATTVKDALRDAGICIKTTVKA